MKGYLLLMLLMLFVIRSPDCYGQAPSQMSYQATIRDGTGKLVSSKPINMQISILEGSGTGTAAYIETQSTLTNENGLLSISIGSGTKIAGSFPKIKWSEGIYFLKTEISLTGNTDYTITSTNQILSVPYAMSAQKADTANALTNQNLHVNGDTLFITKADYIVIPGLWLLSHMTNVQQLLANGATPLELYTRGYPLDSLYGKTYQGGILFWLDINTGHGFIAAPTDLSTPVPWCQYIFSEVQTSTSLGSGEQNTQTIFARHYVPGDLTAAGDCHDLIIGNYDDWYLPSSEELLLLSKNIGDRPIGNPAEIIYDSKVKHWTSSKIGEIPQSIVNNMAYGESFFSSEMVRAIRSF